MTAYIKDVQEFHPLKNHVFVTDLESGPHLTDGGIIVPDDNMKLHGIRDRWGKVWCVGPEVDDLHPGDWVFVKHGRWTEGIVLQTADGEIKIWRVDYPDNVLVATDDYPLANQPL